MVWTHAHIDRSGKQDWAWVGLDPKTGQVKKRFFDIDSTDDPKLVANNLHRCAPDHATERFFLHGSGALIDIESGKMQTFEAARTTCFSGFFPANGLVYFTPSSCSCANWLRGFKAYAPAAPNKAHKTEPWVVGRAHGPIENPKSKIENSSDWPTYRHDFHRSGATAQTVPATAQPLWMATLGGRLSAPTIAGESVYLAAVDSHRVFALNAADGKIRWQFTAGGRVDTPPTIHNGLALFGCRDGWVYALRTLDGELAWRFRAAPEERLISAFGQLESPWPVVGGMLVMDGVAYFGAGRHTSGDGGIFVYALNLENRSIVWQQQCGIS